MACDLPHGYWQTRVHRLPNAASVEISVLAELVQCFLRIEQEHQASVRNTVRSFSCNHLVLIEGKHRVHARQDRRVDIRIRRTKESFLFSLPGEQVSSATVNGSPARIALDPPAWIALRQSRVPECDRAESIQTERWYVRWRCWSGSCCWQGVRRDT